MAAKSSTMGSYVDDPIRFSIDGSIKGIVTVSYGWREGAMYTLAKEQLIRDHAMFLEALCIPYIMKVSRPMKETKQTLKFRPTCIDINQVRNNYDSCYVADIAVKGVTLSSVGYKNTVLTGLTEEMYQEMVLAIREKLEVEITVTVKRPETKQEEVRRVRSTIGHTAALDLADRYLDGVK